MTTVTNIQEFVLTYRNKDNSAFCIKPKSDFEIEEKGGKVIISKKGGGCYKESDLIKMMNGENGIKLYTYFDNTYTDVTVVSGHLKSISNKTKEDNIGKLELNRFI